ncbi:MAG: hypothetical protein ACRDPD_24325 [Streptosporangiaceae bacterium]
MLEPLKQAGAWHTHPLVAALSPFGPAGGFGGGLNQLPRARCYGRLAEIPAVGGEMPLAPGMPLVVGPSAVIGGRTVSLGGTVLIGEDDPIELSPFTAQLLRARRTRPSIARHRRSQPVTAPRHTKDQRCTENRGER